MAELKTGTFVASVEGGRIDSMNLISHVFIK